MPYYQDYGTECKPITSYEQLFVHAEHPPTWYEQTAKLSQRSSYVIKNTSVECHVAHAIYNASPPERIDGHHVPRTVVCHDMKNGYCEDKYTNEVVPIGNGYTFTQWQNIDIFIYFSHHFITIPPLAWINVAHRNGVKILGTVITEWEAGEKLCNQFLKDEEEVIRFADALVAISAACKLDGWLINIENTVQIEKVPLLLHFLKNLSRKLHEAVNGSVVLWYDSIIDSGELKWQNELNCHNRPFFEMCDGIFLNYNWDNEHLIRTACFAEDLLSDIYVGIDVFGRNTPYAAGADCAKAVAWIRKLRLSLAIFAPGWTHESLDPIPAETFNLRFFENDYKLWSALAPYLFYHPLSECFSTGFNPGVTKDSFLLQRQEVLLPFMGCCVRPTMVDNRLCFKVVSNPDKHREWHHLLATNIAVQEGITIEIHTKKAHPSGCPHVDIQLIMASVCAKEVKLTDECYFDDSDDELDGLDECFQWLGLSDPAVGKPLRRSCICGREGGGNQNNARLLFKVHLPAPNILHHVYINMPTKGEVIITRISMRE